MVAVGSQVKTHDCGCFDCECRGREVRKLRAEVERLKAKIKGPSVWPCGVCGTPQVLTCPVCYEAKIEAALALHGPWARGGSTCRACALTYPCPTVVALTGGRE